MKGKDLNMDNEVVLIGWREIARLFPFSERKLRGRYGKELRDAGVVFFVRRGVQGGGLLVRSPL